MVEEGLKKRLLGAAVLAALAVIFVPMLIDEPASEKLVMQPMPAPPEPYPEVGAEEFVVRQPIPLESPVNEFQRLPEPETEPPPTPQNTATEQPKLGAWAIQVGSFSERKNAQRLVEKLRHAGFQSPDPERAAVDNEVHYRVLVGPMLERSTAQSQQPRIDAISGTKSLLIKFR